MKRLVQILLIFLISNLVILKGESQNENPNYDQALAQQLGADDYGMRFYYLAILSTGSNDSIAPDYIRVCFDSHMKNIRRMVDEGKMIIAGPLGKNMRNYRGIFIISMEKEEEVHHELLQDMTISEKLLEYTLIPWYGSAALPLYLEQSDKIWKIKP
jgi:hypothetical protein